jgi:hypothetical protein
MADRFRKKPVVIEAIQFVGVPPDGTNATRIIDWILTGDLSARFHVTEDDDAFIAIDTLEGTMRADRGDWIIKGVAGEFYPCKPDIFEATYEPVEDGGVS